MSSEVWGAAACKPGSLWSTCTFKDCLEWNASEVIRVETDLCAGGAAWLHDCEAGLFLCSLPVTVSEPRYAVRLLDLRGNHSWSLAVEHVHGYHFACMLACTGCGSLMHSPGG